MYNLLAQDTINLKPNPNSNFGYLGGLTIPGLISALIRLTVVVAAIVFFFILVIGGIRWIASGGDKAQTEGARNQITAALVGLVIVFAAWAIVALINTFFHIDIFSLAIPSV
jgi:hypothetical protein